MKTNIVSQRSLRVILLSLALLFSSATVTAQTTTFTYQGKLADTGTPANGSYDFQFKMFDALTGGSAIASASVNGVAVTNGVFTVNLDFGVCAACFNGGSRFLAITVKPTSGSTFTDLNPRQQITSAPYAIKSQNATSADGLSVACVSCVTSSQIGSVSGSSITGTIPVSGVPAGSGNYIQNGLSQQAASNFSISGNGTAAGTLSGGVVNANTQYNLAGSRVLSIPGSFNVFAGVGAGDHNTSGSSNAFFGALAGQQNTDASDNSFFGAGTGSLNTGQQNSFFGSHAGQSNMGASFNSFFGTFAGDGNTTGGSNSFFGASAGVLNMTGGSNSFFGASAGAANTTAAYNSFFGTNAGLNNNGSSNAFFGAFSGQVNTAGEQNSFFGRSSGVANIDGSANAFFGYLAGGANTHGSFNSIFGAFAGDFNQSGGSNSFFGSTAGQNNISGSFNSFFGTRAGRSNHADRNSFFGYNAGLSNTDGMGNAFFGDSTGMSSIGGSQNSFFGGGAGFFNTDGQNNTFIGVEAGGGNSMGDFNTIVGAFADVGVNNLDHATAIGAGAVVSTNNTIVLGRSAGFDTVRIPGTLVVESPSGATATHLCINASQEVSVCSSSLRYKTNVLSLNSGLELVHRLRPVTFDWKTTGQKDLGLIAEEVNTVEPLLVTRDKTGEIQGVKYDQLSVVLINAIKEQQAQITNQQTRMQAQQTQINTQLLEIQNQQTQLDSLLKIVCLDHPGADLCKPKSNQ